METKDNTTAKTEAVNTATVVSTDTTRASVVPETNQTTQDTKTEETNKTNDKSAESGLKAEIRKLRLERRELRERMENLEKSVKVKETPKEEEPTSLIDDPDKWAKIQTAKIKNDAIAEMKAQQAYEARLAEIKREGEQAITELLDQPEISGDMDKVEEIDAIIMANPRLSKMVAEYPMSASKEALELWKKDKGIDSNSKKLAIEAKSNATLIKPTKTQSVPNRTKADIMEDMNKLDPKTDGNWKSKQEILLKELSSFGKK